jgi:predicted amidohydrolase
MRVAGLQCDLVWEDPHANRERLGPRIEDAARAGARLVVLPEMWPSGFSMATERIAEDEGGPSERFLAESAGATGAAVGGSVAQRRAAGAKARNVFVLALPDGAVHRYAKIHPFSYGGESRHYDAGDAAVTVTWEGVRVTPLVCYDLRFPELFAAAASRTDLFVVVANWPAARAAHWDALLTARAIETQAYVLGVNRVGAGGGLDYVGGSRLVGPLGQTLDGDASADGAPRERVVAGDVEPAEVAAVRARFPFLADRRPDVYRRIRGEPPV